MAAIALSSLIATAVFLAAMERAMIDEGVPLRWRERVWAYPVSAVLFYAMFWIGAFGGN